MNIEECLNFCNLYLINSLMMNTQKDRTLSHHSKQKTQQYRHKNKKRKHLKFENANKLLINQDSNSKSPRTPRNAKTPKSKKQKFQKGIITPSNQQKLQVKNQKHKDLQIDDLLNNLYISTTKKALNAFQQSIGTNKYNKNSTYKKPEQILWSHWQRQQLKSSRKQKSNRQVTLAFQNFYQPYQRSQKLRKQDIMYVPNNRSPIDKLKINYQNKQRSLTPQNKRSKSGRKREKDFYKVNTSPIKKEKTLSNSNLMNKFENQIKEQKQKKYKQRTIYTKTQSKTKYDDKAQIQQQEQQIILNTKVRDALTCLSQMRTPPKPIKIQIKRT